MELNNSSVERDHFPTHVPFFRRHVAACTGILQVSTAGACKQWPPVVSSQTTRQLMRCYRYTFIWYTDIHLDVKHFLSALETDKNIDLSWKIIPPKEQKRGQKEKQCLSYIWNKYHVKKYKVQFFKQKPLLQEVHRRSMVHKNRTASNIIWQLPYLELLKALSQAPRSLKVYSCDTACTVQEEYLS